ncbi:hypothetical protein [Flavivirga algicola]|uniref:Uncharacterized protein n=1 Tax=Flavivirga algicola TaxID=2729136 RepID=A0ABX1S4H1_9FLAO|nr:hypothetical protein [Flavivirga algicola]NMH89664.1 hypothetical protein [Flavivirga algicola]
MNKYLLIAGTLCLVLGLFHLILGEILIFKNKKEHKKIIPTIVTCCIKERHLRIIWVSWYLVSVFGWCIGVLLIKIGTMQTEWRADLMQFIMTSITITMLCSSLLVFIATKGKHLGWVVLLIIGILTLLGI